MLGSPKYTGSKFRRPSRAVGAVKLSVSRPSCLTLTMHVNYFNFWGYPSEINRPTCTRHNYIADTTQLLLHCILQYVYITEIEDFVFSACQKVFSMMSSDTL